MAADRRDDETRLATFPRRNRDTQNLEEIRITAAEFQGKFLVGVRTWFRTRPDGPDDDGWRPSKIGLTIRSHELDDWSAAIDRAKAMLAEREGRDSGTGRPKMTPTRRAGWVAPPHQRDRAYRSEPLLNQLQDRSAPFDEFDKK